jgi:hypothetical protein
MKYIYNSAYKLFTDIWNCVIIIRNEENIAPLGNINQLTNDNKWLYVEVL